MVRKLILECRLAVGDIVMLTGVVRDLHLHHPCRFVTDVRTHFPALWRHNALLTPLHIREPGVEIVDCDALADWLGEHAPLHCVQAVAAGLARRLGLPFFGTLAGGDIPLSDRERREPSEVARRLGVDLPYWIVVAGGKQDCPVKWWDPARFQAVVDEFRGKMLFVQVGAAQHAHPPLAGVLDLRGRTTLRELVRLVHHAQGVLCPITSLMHLAAAVETRPGHPRHRACVVIAGGREAPHWAAYPNHQFVHTVGSLPCCDGNGCWRSLTFPTPDGNPAKERDHVCLDVIDRLPHCMDLITPGIVARQIRLHFDTGQLRELTPAEANAAERLLTRPTTLRRSAARAHRDRSARTPTPPPVITLCVLTFGDHLRMVRRCIESVRKLCPRPRYRLVVGGNEVSDRTRRYLLRRLEDGTIDRLHLSPVNLNKSPMMRRLFADLDTEYIWWLDDDAEITDPGALDLRLITARAAPVSTVLWGELHRCDLDRWTESGLDVRAWVRAAPWFRGRPIGADRWRFATGGDWFARTAALRAMDWPDPRLIMTAEDVLLGEAIRQQGWRMSDIGRIGTEIWPEPSRGPDRHAIMLEQFGLARAAPST